MHTSHYSRPEKPAIYRLPPKKDYIQYHVYYITRSIYHYAYARHTQVNWKKETKKEKKVNEKKKRKRNTKKEKKEKKIQEKQEKTRRQEDKARTGKKKNIILADPRN